MHPESNASFFSIFHGIGKDVYNDLFDTHFIAVKTFGYIAVQIELQAQTFFLGTVGHHVHQSIDHKRQVVFHRKYLDLARLDP